MNDKETQTPHGQDVFGIHERCHCDICESKRSAVRRLVDSFSHIPGSWMEELIAHRGECLLLPMWGTLFIPKDAADRRNMERLLCPIEASNEEDEEFANAGWQAVAGTGILAIEFDGELLLGIHGAGYDFYEHHWAKLYDALDYHWH